MQIPTFSIKEVIRFLRNHRNKQFNYSNPFSNKSHECGKQNSCLISAFLDGKGVKFRSVNGHGNEGWDATMKAIVKITDMPTHISDVHNKATNIYDRTGRQILRNMRNDPDWKKVL